jgi:hypothetical protein
MRAIGSKVVFCGSPSNPDDIKGSGLVYGFRKRHKSVKVEREISPSVLTSVEPGCSDVYGIDFLHSTELL